MRKPILATLFCLLMLSGCLPGKDAFTEKRLRLSATIERNQAVRVEGTTNLPDGSVLFLKVEAAPQYETGATWTGRAVVHQGRFSLETIHTVALPYRCTCIYSTALNPDQRNRFSADSLPFAVDPGWVVEPLADGGVHLQTTIEATFGTPDQHRELLIKELDEIESGAASLERELATIDQAHLPGNGFARWLRLHRDRVRKLGLAKYTTSFYYGDAHRDLTTLAQAVHGVFLLKLAGFEKDAKEAAKHEKEPKRAMDLVKKIKAEIDQKRQLLP